MKFTQPRFGTGGVRFGGKSSFDRPAQDATDVGGPGKALTAKATARRLAMFAESVAVLEQLPNEGETLHGRLTGRCDIMVLVAALIGKVGGPARIRLSTLGYNLRNLVEMLRLLDEGYASKITLLCGKFFLVHNRGLFEESQRELAKRGSAAGYARTHVKVVTLDTPAGYYCLEGSANLRTNGNFEQFCLTRSREVHDWHAEWIDDMVARSGLGSGSGEVKAKG